MSSLEKWKIPGKTNVQDASEPHIAQQSTPAHCPHEEEHQMPRPHVGLLGGPVQQAETQRARVVYPV